MDPNYNSRYLRDIATKAYPTRLPLLGTVAGVLLACRSSLAAVQQWLASFCSNTFAWAANPTRQHLPSHTATNLGVSHARSKPGRSLPSNRGNPLGAMLGLEVLSPAKALN